jgi:hypothetical protein
MVSRIHLARILAGVSALAMILADAGEAKAGTGSLKGVVVTGTGGTVPGTDPIFYYDFQVYVANGYQVNNGDYFTFQSLLGVTPPGSSPLPGSTYSVSSLYDFLGPNSPTFTPTGLSSGYPTASVEFEYLGSAPIVGDDSTPFGKYVGEFIIVAGVPIPSLPPIVYYDAQSHESAPPNNIYLQDPANGTQGIIALNVPEPSSVVLLMLGSGVLPLLWMRHRRSIIPASPQFAPVRRA